MTPDLPCPPGKVIQLVCEIENTTHFNLDMIKGRRIVVLFPGQGTQRVGMLNNLLATSERIRKMVAMADTILGYRLSELIERGPMQTLTQTVHAQPALVLASLAWWQWAKEEMQHEGMPLEEVIAMAGHSVGEYAALAASNVFTFEEALRLASLRGSIMQAGYGGKEAMTKASVIEGIEGMMLVVTSNGSCDPTEIEARLRQNLDPLKANLAAINSSRQFVISGERKEVERAKGGWLKDQLWVSRMRELRGVSCPFHSPLMEEAQESFRIRSDKLFSRSKSPGQFPVISNVTGRPHVWSDLRSMMMRQITATVRWNDTIKYCIQQGASQFVTLGPGSVLADLMREDPQLSTNILEINEHT